MGSGPCGRRCCHRATSRGQAVMPCVSAALASDRLQGRGAAPAGGCSWPRALPTPIGTAPAGANHARGRSRLLAAALARCFSHGRPPLSGAWPWVAVPAWGLVVAGRPSSLPSLRKRNKNA
ncbi:hypothetical protein BHM03_00051621 [Ensete ventricosum]|nr:hypothetical protein BHM03_00051621 [Ensete ventricosum]